MTDNTPEHTPLHAAHLAAGARMVDFGGWEMPINYGSQIDEHHQVRRAAGMFDVSHMTVVDIYGNDARACLSTLLANDVAKLQAPGKALYSCMLNEAGGVIDDLITYYLRDDWFRVVVNAATRVKDLAWMLEQSDGFDVSVIEQVGLAMIAVQGPQARQLTAPLLGDEFAGRALAVKPFSAIECEQLFVARTGYTGEDGFELVMPSADAEPFWNRLLAAGVKPCGLGARDTLRLEAGMNLYGQDMDETVSPLESGLAWTLAMQDERAFIGRRALQQQLDAGPARKLVGLVLDGRGVLRHGQRVHSDAGDGEITSGSFSPTLERAIALARVPVATGGDCEVDIRGRLLPARVVRPPFVRNGEACAGIIEN